MTADYALPSPDYWAGREIYQMIMHIIGKLGEDKKANWPSHLAEIAYAYNST